MANPQLENGHLKIANEIWDRLMTVEMTGAEFRLVMAVIRKTYGWRRKECEASLEEMSGLTGLNGRSVRRSRDILIRENILVYEPATGRGNKSKWSFNKDWQSWIKVDRQTHLKVDTQTHLSRPTFFDKGGPPDPPLRPSRPTFTTIQTHLSRHKSKKTKKQLAPKDNIKDNIKDKRIVASDLAHDIFAEKFSAKFDCPYQNCQADFVQLSRLRKTLGIKSKDKPECWCKAVENYLETPLSNYTLKDLATRYAIFSKYSLDRYGKPVEEFKYEDHFL